jgi:lipopolysaccharide transport system permease protein
MDLAVSFLILVGLLVYYRIEVAWTILLLPVLVLLTTLLAIAVGMWMSAMNVKYRDIRYALPFLIQIWMFATPIIYPSSLVPRSWRWVLAINPLTGIIDGYRAALFGSRLDWPVFTFSVIITMTLLFYSAYTFRRMEKTFADIV